MIKIMIMDVDGTLTDGKLYISSTGELIKVFNVKDGLGIKKLHNNGIIPVLITGRESDILVRRAKELGITEVYQGISNKLEILSEVASKFDCNFSQFAYIGDDENDLNCMKLCGICGCPADAINTVKEVSDFISNLKGGDGAVREFIEYLLCKQNNTDEMD